MRLGGVTAEWPVIDLFSGSGGMSYGFAKRPPFRIIAAVDAEIAKPCEGTGKLGCNLTYEANLGIRPWNDDLSEGQPIRLLERNGLSRGELTVLLCCPPCTDFSRAKPANHLTDSPKNSLVVRCADIVEALFPEFVVMENARELITGNNSHHYRTFVSRLKELGYDVRGKVNLLTRFGLPQIRERAIVIASRLGKTKTLDDLWEGWSVKEGATAVRHAIGHLSIEKLDAGEMSTEDSMHISPGFGTGVVRERMDAIPRDGGSWFDLATHPRGDKLLIASMKDRLRRKDLGSHPDVYGRLAWNRPAVTIKRECAHVGNGRYAHPEQTRLLTVREMAILQGFPEEYTFASNSLANRYRHIGDAVPPLISYQLSALVAWMKTGFKPQPDQWILPGTSLRVTDVVPEIPSGLFTNRTSAAAAL